MISTLTELPRERILALAKQHGASNIRVFGSVARGQARSDSDLDLLVDMEKERSLFDLVRLSEDLESLLGAKIDVVTEASLSPYMADSIQSEAVKL